MRAASLRAFPAARYRPVTSGPYRGSFAIADRSTFQFFPWFRFVADGLRHGQIRQWNPTLLAGLPVTPNGNVSPYYPPTWLGAVLSPYDAYDLFVLLHLVIGALGVFVLSRALGARAGPAWLAGLLAFTAAFWVHWSTHLVHLAGMVWVPWVLAATAWLVAGGGGTVTD